uniref:NADH-ubiquinone oxidoreductase chain 4 n=1 Tax=Centrorhynchus aluconis TaxID=1795424 RepID=A0A140DJ65_9BILA|nr:NADH dehydrogenase subunit 4 [Centrorhynchus aluconis]
MMGGLLMNLFWALVLGGVICWYVVVVNFGVGSGVIYESEGLVIDSVVGGIVLLVGAVWVGMGSVYGGDFSKKLSVNNSRRVLSEGSLSYVLVLMMVSVFVVDSWFGFYIFYEGSMVPLLIGVCLFGSYYERLASVMYLMVYLILFSAPLVLVLLVCLGAADSVKMGSWGVLWVWGWAWLVLMGSMLVKVPLWGLHGWLPKVHVEAPSWGSVVLAGVMIKMGVYGLWRMRGEVMVGEDWGWLWVWALFGGVVASLMCLFSSDFKMLVAYSSVFHMAGVVWLSGWMLGGGWRGVVIVVMMHGIVSGALFMLVGSLGDIGESRSLVLLSGLVDYLSVGGVVVISSFVLNAGFPFSGNMLGELEVVLGVLTVWGLGWVVLAVMLFVGSLFNMYLLMVVFSSGQVCKDLSVWAGVVVGVSVLLAVSAGSLAVLGVVY